MLMNLICKNQNGILKMGEGRPGVGKTERAVSTAKEGIGERQKDAETSRGAQFTETVTEETGGRNQEVGEEKVRGSGGHWSSRREEGDWAGRHWRT